MHPNTARSAALLALAIALASPLSAQQSSINSTSQGRAGGPVSALPIQSFVNSAGYRMLSANDLGMHCGDLDDRIATILPPFNTVHVQVIQRGNPPKIVDNNSVNVVYTAISQPDDPALVNAPVVAADNSIFKTNFWQTAVKTYAPFYPAGVLSLYLSPTLPRRGGDIGLPTPDVERLYLGDGNVELHQQTMPSVTSFVVDPLTGAPSSVSLAPYRANRPQQCKTFTGSAPVFINFPFGYVAPNVKWFAAEGIPMAPFDDEGRENPYPMLRFQAKLNATSQTVASLDTVVPVAGESDCKSCHLPAPGGNGTATARLTDPTTAEQDPQNGKVLQWASEEWAADINMLRLHDLMHATKLFAGFNPNNGVGKSPVACQSCHYTPALDLLHLGPQAAHGLTQTTHGSMSRVMHNGHGNLKTATGAMVFPNMPPPTDPRRMANQSAAPINTFEKTVLERTCYQCHPGKRTQCLRGAMTQAGAVCQDCHGQMRQVGDDFTRAKPAGNFIVRSDYYTNPATPRVPWANEPTCGSCHTGDANSNMTTAPGTIAAPDSIRLLQAYLSTDNRAKPILPANLRFAEPRVTTGPATGNPQLFRFSVDGHGGVFCEGCHGSTHAEWPVAGANANDNVTAGQLQGHVGAIIECDTCHTGTMATSLDGPHGLHPVGNGGLSASWVSRHGDFAERRLGECAACHGTRGEGTVLSRVAMDRPGLRCERGTSCPTGNATITLPAKTQVGCAHCHSNPLGNGVAAAPAATTNP